MFWTAKLPDQIKCIALMGELCYLLTLSNFDGNTLHLKYWFSKPESIIVHAKDYRFNPIFANKKVKNVATFIMECK